MTVKFPAVNAPVRILEIFDTFQEAEASEREAWMAMPGVDKMILLEQLRAEFYPDERISPQGLQRVLEIID